MKEALKSIKVYIFGGIALVLGYIPFIVAVSMWASANASSAIAQASLFTTYPYVEWAIMAIYILIGFVWGDQHYASYQRKNKKYGEAAPDEIKAECWKRRLPFFIGAIGVAILCLVLEIIAGMNGAIYPFTYI